MVTFSILEKLKRPTLRQRRMLRLTRRLMAACCTAIAAFATLQCVTASIVTQPVVVAARLIPRGARIGAEDVEIRQMPVSDGWDTALDAANQAAGGIAQTDIAAGQPLFGAIVSRRPVAEPGQTVIDVGSPARWTASRPVMSWIWYPAPLATLRLVRLHRVTNPQAAGHAFSRDRPRRWMPPMTMR